MKVVTTHKSKIRKCEENIYLHVRSKRDAKTIICEEVTNC